MKRHMVEIRDDPGEFDSISMANCLMLLSDQSPIISRVFECKTCNRQFPSFQALGGHRARHKKPRPNTSEAAVGPTNKPKTHECSICGLEFAIGQALGGHMRRHRVEASADDYQHHHHHHHYHYQYPIAAPTTTLTLLPAATASMVKKPQRQSVLSLDLNLTPFENDVELLRIEKAAPVIGCYI